MARFEEPGPSDDCVECSEVPSKRHADILLVIGSFNIPLCKPHLEKLCNDLAAENLVSGSGI